MLKAGGLDSTQNQSALCWIMTPPLIIFAQRRGTSGSYGQSASFLQSRSGATYDSHERTSTLSLKQVELIHCFEARSCRLPTPSAGERRVPVTSALSVTRQCQEGLRGN